MKLKGFHFAVVAEIQEAVTENRNFRQLFRNCTIALKPVYMPMELILNKKIMCLRFLKRSVLKLLDRTVYSTRATTVEIQMREEKESLLHAMLCTFVHISANADMLYDDFFQVTLQNSHFRLACSTL
jgi:hypothetical protein